MAYCWHFTGIENTFQYLAREAADRRAEAVNHTSDIKARSKPVTGQLETRHGISINQQLTIPLSLFLVVPVVLFTEIEAVPVAFDDRGGFPRHRKLSVMHRLRSRVRRRDKGSGWQGSRRLCDTAREGGDATQQGKAAEDKGV